MSSIIAFPRGDGSVVHTFSIPASAWTPGGTLFFGAKSVIDDDVTDAQAVIKQSWGDSAVTDVVINGIAYKQYACNFPSSATSDIQSNGASEAQYLGEFEWVSAAGVPTTFPAAPPKLTCIVYFDVIVEV